MTRERVNEMLACYREKAARCTHLEQEIFELEKLVESFKRSLISDEVNITQVISDMPRGTITSDPTANVGIKVASGFVPQRIREIEKEIDDKKNEVREICPTVVFVQAWLTGLNERERFLVERKEIDSAFWRTVIEEYESKFGERYSKQGLKNIETAALEKIYRIAQ